MLDLNVYRPEKILPILFPVESDVLTAWVKQNALESNLSIFGFFHWYFSNSNNLPLMNQM